MRGSGLVFHWIRSARKEKFTKKKEKITSHATAYDEGIRTSAKPIESYQPQKLISTLPTTSQKLIHLDSHQASNSETILIQKQMRDSREWSMKGINMFSWDFSLFYWIPQFLPFNIDTGLMPLALVRLRLVSGFVTHFSGFRFVFSKNIQSSSTPDEHDDD